MANTKKTRKAYKPKPCVLPLGMRKAIAFEMPGFQASVALGMDHLEEQHVYDLLSNADMVRRIAPDGHEILPIAHEMVLAVAEIQARAQRVGKLGVTGDEMRVLREGVGRTMVYLRTVSNFAIDQAARAALAEFNRAGVLRV
ncbi:hypothetical protein GTP55_25575 [Duganella sp. FT109W]|uniref:Uncharacterized protein n=1 Tax=Duganella margarita TaxID=2692170 RepID=A0ABW9WNA7_9BURK|nr:hypothetical protein [Duganella margarita]MYN42719.1 hypothetical protein [Duganella margarita]